MRRFFIFITMFMTTLFCMGNKADLFGSWKNHNVILTINNDSLSFTEINNESDLYTYSVSNDTINYQSEIDKYDGIINHIKIVYIDKHYLGIKFDNDTTVYEFIKIKKQKL